ncbi:MAG TPA: hypothetical protein VFI13_09510, partial [Gemmatimonadales bacterium]|nr:hypothetical protein [Gemmatimonadales bacterium]
MPSPSHPPMPAPAQLTLETGYAAYRPVGDGPPAPVIEALLATLAWCRDAGVTRLLADVRGLT